MAKRTQWVKEEPENFTFKGCQMNVRFGPRRRFGDLSLI